MIRNRATAEGHELGFHLARLCDEAEAKARLVAPGIPRRCRSCAFRAGKHLANGKPYPQLDALKSVIQHTPFQCPNRAHELCAGWVMLMLAYHGEPAGPTPWLH